MKVLLAMDGSSFSEAAARSVAARPWPPGCEVKIITVVEPFHTYMVEGWTLPEGFWTDIDQAAQRQASEAIEMAIRQFDDAKGLAISSEILKGSPASAILDEAESWGADLIVMGSHGYTGLKRLLLGSVSHAVISHATCSVEIVRSREAPAENGDAAG
jgi:nucleotide-binding universal stress UspA family protein